MYVVIGANGYVGSYILKNIIEKTEEKILALGCDISSYPYSNKRIIIQECDITSPADVKKVADMLMEEEEIKGVYLAAYHHPDAVKSNPRLAWNINITALSYCLNAWPKFKCLFYVSTEMVYGACDLNYRFKENDKVDPVNLYGKHKVVAESIVLGYEYNVVRFPFVIGKSLLPNKPHFYDQIIDTVKTGHNIEMFVNAYKTALDFDTATSIVIDLIENYNENTPKILNVAGDDILSKYDIGVKIIQKNRLDTSKVLPITMGEENKIFTEKRANCTLLDNSLLKKTLKVSTIKMKF